MNENKIEIVKCVTSGGGFVAGFLYVITGWNNGVQITRTDESGDAITDIFVTGGMGKGLYNHCIHEASFEPFCTVKGEYYG